MVAARLATMKQGTRTDLAANEAKSQPDAASRLNVSVARAERKLGEITAKLPKAPVESRGQGRGKKQVAGPDLISKASALADMGVTKQEAHRGGEACWPALSPSCTSGASRAMRAAR
jgi:hypothetical protein